MKKISLESLTAREILSREELKKIIGGLDGSASGGDSGGTCSVSVTCNSGDNTISCSGSGGSCQYKDDTAWSIGWVQCDKDPKVSCRKD